jgi:hypothetical protein
MSNSNQASQLNQYKVWMIPILAAMLIGVIIYNNYNAANSATKCSLNAPLETSVPSVVGASTNSAPGMMQTAKDVNAAPTTVSVEKLVPVIPLVEAKNLNPFSTRVPFETPRSENIERKPEIAGVPLKLSEEISSPASGELSSKTVEETPLAEPPKLNVTGVFRNGTRMAALINDRVIYPGDIVAEGWRLVAIDARGLVLEPIAR